MRREVERVVRMEFQIWVRFICQHAGGRRDRGSGAPPVSRMTDLVGGLIEQSVFIRILELLDRIIILQRPTRSHRPRAQTNHLPSVPSLRLTPLLTCTKRKTRTSYQIPPQTPRPQRSNYTPAPHQPPYSDPESSFPCCMSLSVAPKRPRGGGRRV